jgi:hypothetical protein
MQSISISKRPGQAGTQSKMRARMALEIAAINRIGGCDFSTDVHYTSHFSTWLQGGARDATVRNVVNIQADVPFPCRRAPCVSR